MVLDDGGGGCRSGYIAAFERFYCWAFVCMYSSELKIRSAARRSRRKEGCNSSQY